MLGIHGRADGARKRFSELRHVGQSRVDAHARGRMLVGANAEALLFRACFGAPNLRRVSERSCTCGTKGGDTPSGAHFTWANDSKKS